MRCRTAKPLSYRHSRRRSVVRADAKRGTSTQVKVVAMVIKDPHVVESRQEAERRYAEYMAFHRPWQPGEAQKSGTAE